MTSDTSRVAAPLSCAEAIPSGIDLSFVDRGVRPQDDLFGHVNGRWLADYEIPADRATDGAFRTLYDRAEEQIRDLITRAIRETRDLMFALCPPILTLSLIHI